MRRNVALFCAVALTLSTAASLTAQQRPPAQDTVPKTPQERIRERLRALRPIGAPDTVASEDSARAPAQRVRADRADDPAMSRDSIWEALLNLSGYSVTEYRGDTATFRADSGNLNLRGHALVLRDGQQVEAGRITYADSLSLICGYGKPRVSGTGMTPVESDSLCYDIERGMGVLRGATTSVMEGANWRILSDETFTRGENQYSHDTKFTDCDLPWDQVHYHFNAKEVMVKRGNLLVARDVTMTFADVPVFWLPFMVQSLSQGRRSGVLMPRFGINDIARTSTRYSRRIEDIGFYWAMNDHLGSEVAFDWMSNNWMGLRGSFDYNYLDKFIRGGATVRQLWKDEGGTELMVASQNSWEPNERTNIRGNFNYATSSDFIKTRSLDPREQNRNISSDFNFSRRMDWGSLTLGARRDQSISQDQVTQTLPSVGLTLSPITLFRPAGSETRWFNNATFGANADVARGGRSVGEENTSPVAQSSTETTAKMSGNFTVGKLAFRQRFSLVDGNVEAREVPLVTADSVRILPASSKRANEWEVGVDYQQRLIGTSTITPRLGMRGQSLQSAETGNQLVSSPTQLNLGVGLNADLYRVFGLPIGSFAAFRHKLSPGFSYTYSPKPNADSLQRKVFGGLSNSLEQNSLSISLNQTIEAKYRESRDAAQIAADSIAADTATGPRRSQAARTLRLLSINTSAVVYDFVQARELNTGVQTTTLTNDFQSDLLQGFTFNVTHDLFRPVEAAEGGESTVADREFSPHLSKVGASFGVSGNSWLFRILRLGRRDTMPTDPGDVGSPTQPAEGGVPVDRTQAEYGLIGSRRRNMVGTQSGPVGSWSAQLQYSLLRPREGALQTDPNLLFQRENDNQTLSGTVNFQPTENWTAAWETSYSISKGEFNNHILRLTRKLHDWDANFDFIKNQNGNFSFNFNVRLRANPDIKLDWSQHDVADGNIPRFR